MWSIAAPATHTGPQELSLALNLANQPPFVPTAQQLRTLWTLYALFDSRKGRPHPDLMGRGESDAFRDAVHDAYNQVYDGRRLQELRDRLRIAVTQCPYCGFGQIQQLDHHLVKNQYPLLSIYPRNLVPACATCNAMRPRRNVTEPNHFPLNPYLEQFPSGVFLFAQATIRRPSGAIHVTFRIRQIRGMTHQMRRRLNKHMKTYDLNRRFQAQINIYLGEQQAGFNLAYQGGPRAFRAYLLAAARAASARFGRNDWRAALLVALAQNSEFCAGGFKKALGEVPRGA